MPNAIACCIFFVLFKYNDVKFVICWMFYCFFYCNNVVSLCTLHVASWLQVVSNKCTRKAIRLLKASLPFHFPVNLRNYSPLFFRGFAFDYARA